MILLGLDFIRMDVLCMYVFGRRGGAVCEDWLFM